MKLEQLLNVEERFEVVKNNPCEKRCKEDNLHEVLRNFEISRGKEENKKDPCNKKCTEDRLHEILHDFLYSKEKEEKKHEERH